MTALWKKFYYLSRIEQLNSLPQVHSFWNQALPHSFAKPPTGLQGMWCSLHQLPAEKVSWAKPQGGVLLLPKLQVQLRRTLSEIHRESRSVQAHAGAMQVLRQGLQKHEVPNPSPRGFPSTKQTERASMWTLRQSLQVCDLNNIFSKILHKP